MQKTENYGLNKPESVDFYNVEDFNENADIVDAKLKEIEQTGSNNSNAIEEHTESKNNPHEVTKTQIGLGNVDNTSDLNKPVSAATKSLVEGHTSNTSNPHLVTKSQVGLGNVPNVATNDQTPTYSDTTTLATLTSGEKLSVAFSKIKLAITNLINHIANKNNPHAVTKAQVGLGNVDNTADGSKSVKYAETAGSAPASDVYAWAKESTKPTYTKSEVELGNVPNVSTNNQTPTYTVPSTLSALVSGEKISVAFGKIAKAVSSFISHLADISNPHSVTKMQVGLGNVDNTSDANKPISTATQTALNDIQSNITEVEKTVTNVQTTADTALATAQDKGWHWIGDFYGTNGLSVSNQKSIAKEFLVISVIDGGTGAADISLENRLLNSDEVEGSVRLASYYYSSAYNGCVGHIYDYANANINVNTGWTQLTGASISVNGIFSRVFYR